MNTRVDQPDPESKPADSIQTDTSDGHEYEEVLDLIGFGRVQWCVLLSSGLLFMTVISETMGMSYITIVSQCEFETSSIDKAVMSAACFIGIFCSSYFWGYLSDSIGRRSVLLYTTLTGSLLSFISIFIPNYWIYVVSRYFVGFFIAGASSTTYAYLGEFFVTRIRPTIINYATLFVGVATVYVPVVAWLVMSMHWSIEVTETFSFRPWRLLTLFYILPGLVGCIMLYRLPETPKLLISMGKADEAYVVLNWIALKNAGKTLEEFKVKKIKSDICTDKENILSVSNSPTISFKNMWKETLPLFKKPYLMNFSISCLVMCGFFVSSAGMALWYPEILNRLRSDTAEDGMTVCDVIDASVYPAQLNVTTAICHDEVHTRSYIDTIIYGLVLIVGYVLIGFVMNLIGRKLAITISLGIASTCAALLLWIQNDIIIIVCFCLYLVLPGLCVSVLSGAVVDLVPTPLRGKALCICLMLGRTGSVFGSNFIGILLESHCTITFGVFSGFVFTCAALTFLIPM